VPPVRRPRDAAGPAYPGRFAAADPDLASLRWTCRRAAGLGVGVVEASGRKHLDRDVPLDLLVAGAEDLAHAAGAQPRTQAVPAEQLPL
jgi:hypothetical protein